MESLVTIKDQRFYTADVSKLIEFSADNKCAIIISENYLSELISSNANFSTNGLNQLIIISESLNTSLPDFIGKPVFILSAIGLEQAIGMAFQSEELNNNVICITGHDRSELKQIIESVLV